MYQILAYGKTGVGGSVLTDIPVITDPNISQRNGHWIFTEDFLLQAVGVFGATIVDAQLYDATWNAINTPQIYPPNLQVTPPTNPQLMDMRQWPVAIPQNEEIALQISDSAGEGGTPVYGLLWISPKVSNLALPAPQSPVGSFGRVRAKFSVTTALTEGVWSSDQPIVISNLIKGGTYCLMGCQVIADDALAYRVNFVRAPLYQGRKLLPGNLVEQAYANIPLAYGPNWLGPLGYFDTFELPLMSILGTDDVNSATYVGYLDLVYMGQNMLLNQPLTV